MERQDFPLKTDGNDMRVLGVKIDAEGLGGGNWDDIFKKVQRKVSFWRLRQLTMEGKVLILKAVILPIVLFVGVVFVPSRAVLWRLDRLIFRFVWGGGWGVGKNKEGLGEKTARQGWERGPRLL